MGRKGSSQASVGNRESEEHGNDSFQPWLEEMQQINLDPKSSSLVEQIARSNINKKRKKDAQRDQDHIQAQLVKKSQKAYKKRQRIADPAIEIDDNGGIVSTTTNKSTSVQFSTPRKKRRITLASPSVSETTPSTTPKKKSKSKSNNTFYDEDGIPVGGPFTQAEDKKLLDWYTRHLDIHKWTKAQFARRAWSTNHNKDKFWVPAYECLPKRDRPSIYKHCKRLFNNFESGSGVWTKEEDTHLTQLVAKYGDKWTKMGEEMDRHPEHCRDRWKNYLVCGDKKKKGKWKKSDRTLGVQACKQYLDKLIEDKVKADQLDLKLADDASNEEREERMQQLRQQHYNDINFTHVSKLMGGQRSRLQVRQQWPKLMRLLDGEVDDASSDVDDDDLVPPSSDEEEELQQREEQVVESHEEEGDEEGREEEILDDDEEEEEDSSSTSTTSSRQSSIEPVVIGLPLDRQLLLVQAVKQQKVDNKEAVKWSLISGSPYFRRRTADELEDAFFKLYRQSGSGDAKFTDVVEHLLESLESLPLPPPVPDDEM